ncbi:MAG: peptidase domain-containing ABC transporter [Lysobacter sp.]|nr:peptidase domain-containing ABC transporter [Lysobacter sp.]
MTRVRLVRQAESGECGLAALAMVASAHGRRFTLRDLRRQLPSASRGTSFARLLQDAGALGLAAQAVEVAPADLGELRLPAILHWEHRHFVVLQSVGRRGDVVVLDPAVGRRVLTPAQLARGFTGYAMELWPDGEPTLTRIPPSLTLRRYVAATPGFGRSVGLLLLISLGLEVAALTAPLLGQWVVDRVIGQKQVELLNVLALTFAAFFALQSMLGWARGRLAVRFGETLSFEWKRRIFDHLIRLPVRFFAHRHLGDVISRFNATEDIRRTLTSTALEAVLDALFGLAALAIMLHYSPLLAGIVVLAVGAYAAVRWVTWQPMLQASEEGFAFSGKEQAHLVETLRAITPLKLFGVERERGARWAVLAGEVRERRTRVATLTSTLGALSTLIFGLETVAVFYFGAAMVIAPGAGMTVGMLVAFVAYKAQFTARMSRFIDHASDFRMLTLHFERLADIADETPECVDAEVPDEAASTPGTVPAHASGDCDAGGSPTLELRDVWFRYADTEPWILRGVQLRVDAGEMLAIVGPSGSGKSTLLKVLLGLMPPTRGAVLYQGKPIEASGIAAYRRAVAAVMQDDLLLSGSVAQNICFFEAEPDTARMEDAARKACILNDVIQLPLGFDTEVGDLGSSLSGGQRQRIILARAIYRQPRVLVLDEATSHLDLVAEQIVSRELSAMALTRIVVAHRPATIRDAHRVLRLDGGTLSPLEGGTAALAELSTA